MRIIDLTFPLENNKHWAPWWARNIVKYKDHKFGRSAIWLLYRLLPRYLINGLGWAMEFIKLSTHGTTHLDAPWHYSPTSNGNRSKTIDEIPLEWCFSNGVVLDVKHKKSGEEICIYDLQSALAKINYKIKPMDIVLIHTGNDRMYGTSEYFSEGAGVSAEATKWLIDQGIKITGIDSWGWDIPLPIQAKRAKESGQNDIFWSAHYVGIEKEYCHLEQLTNLDKLPPSGFKVCCFPLKVKGGSAGPSRVAAIIMD